MKKTKSKKVQKTKKKISVKKKAVKKKLPKKDGKEFRKHKRVKTLIPITVRVTRVEDESQNFYFTKDLSLGGVFLKTEHEIPVGTVIEMELAIHGVNDLIKVKGKVVRVGLEEGKKEGIGVQFVKLDTGTSKGLKKFLGKK